MHSEGSFESVHYVMIITRMNVESDYLDWQTKQEAAEKEVNVR